MHTKSPPSAARRTLLLGALLGCAATPALAAWPFGGETVEGRGAVSRQARQVASFSGVALNLPGKVELRIGEREGVTVETEDNLQALVETVVEDGMLRIRPVRRNLNLRTRHLLVVVHARRIERLSLGGSGSIESDPLRAERINIDLGGSGRIALRGVQAERLAVAVGGSGDFRCGGGKVRLLSVSVGGSGDVDVGQVEVQDASVSIAGSGDVTLWAQQDLNASIAGSGDVSYYGDPRVRRSIAGSGDARRLAAAPRQGSAQ